VKHIYVVTRIVYTDKTCYSSLWYDRKISKHKKIWKTILRMKAHI